MVTVRRVRTSALRPEILAVFVANFLPLVGVIALEWNVAVLVTVYWFELAVLCFWACVRALFAGRPSEFDSELLLLGALADRPIVVPIPGTGVGIQLSTLPVLAVAVPVLTLVWLLVGTFTVGVVGTEALLEPAALSAVTLAVGVIAVSEGGRTALEYFYRGGYREHSAQTAIHAVVVRCGVLFVGLFTALFAATADPAVASDDPIADVDPGVVGVPVLVAIVLVKLGFDLASVYSDRLAAIGESIGKSFGVEFDRTNEPPTRDRVDDPLLDARRRVRPSRWGQLLVGWSHARRHPRAVVFGAALVVVAVLFVLAGMWTIATGLVAVGVAALLLLHVDYWLRYGGVEYRLDDDAIVAYDRLFGTPLWRVDVWDESGLRVERDRLDEWRATVTVVLELPERERRLPGLRSAAPVLEVFDRWADESRLE